MLYDSVDRESVEKMVRAFYAVIIEDDLVGPYFRKALGDDLRNEKWYEHLNTLNRFWLMMMTGDRHGYWGDPFPPHAFIGPLYPETFQRWLELFHKVIHQFFVPEIAQKFYKKAEVLAEQFMENLDVNGEEED